MPKSMTGYGRACTQESGWIVTWEIRSLNNRHLDLKWKIPPTMYAHQKDWEPLVRNVANRGGVELFLNVRILSPELQSIRLDTNLAQSMIQELTSVAAAQGVEFTADLNRLMAIPALWKDTGMIDNDELKNSLSATLTRALSDWDEARVREGLALEDDLRARFAHLAGLVEQIKVLAADTAQDRFAQLQARVAKLVEDAGVQIDPDRMLQELAIIADRIDVSEELTRLDVHLQGIDGFFNQSVPVGRKLDFMVQECFREINTCGNKCQNTSISQLVVEFKGELEKCREQIQNLE